MDFIEAEYRSLSMEVITLEYVYRMWGGEVPLEDIQGGCSSYSGNGAKSGA